MNDLISRTALKQQIAVWQRIDPYNMLSMAAGAFIGEVDKSPTVDAVQVVRCKDCKWWHKGDEPDPNGRCECNCNGDWWLPEDYCSCAERRDKDALD